MEKFDKKIILYFKGPTQTTCRIMSNYLIYVSSL